MRVGPRVPRRFFVTTGVGESDLQIHAGSLDKALKEAGIENYNLIFYTSILPKEAEEIRREDVRLKFGSVLECIAAIAHASREERATAGIVFGWVYDKQKNEKLGGLVAEYHGNGDEKEAREVLQKSVVEMFNTRFDSKKYELRDVRFVIRSFVPKRKFGSVVVAICFVDYEFEEA